MWETHAKIFAKGNETEMLRPYIFCVFVVFLDVFNVFAEMFSVRTTPWDSTRVRHRVAALENKLPVNNVTVAQLFVFVETFINCNCIQ